jgi:S1-C subfamily serine protease
VKLPSLQPRHPGSLAGTAILCLTLTACSASSTASNHPSGASASASSPVDNVSRAPAPSAGIDTLRERAIAKVSPSVVRVKNVGIGLGSGIIMTKDGYIVTNHHVVANAHQIRVTLSDGQALTARLVGADATDDLAVIKVHASNLPAATFGNSSRLIVGQTVLAIGNPLGITRTVTDGIVSALNRTVLEGQGSTDSIRNAVQTSAPINPGNSGGALIDLAGHVIGVPTLTAVDPEFNAPAAGIGFAIPSDTVVNITSQIVRHGRVIHSGRAALGISAESVTPALAAQFGLPVSQGVLVANLLKGGGAQRAGIRKDDIIVKVDSHTITSLNDLVTALATKSPGQTTRVTVVTTGGNHKTYTVRLGELQVSSNG